MNGVEINTRAYVATRLLLRWDYLYAVTLKTKVFGDYNHARLEVSWITSTRGLLLRGYTGTGGGARVPAPPPPPGSATGGNHMHDHSRFQLVIDDNTGVSLSLSLFLSLSTTHDVPQAPTQPSGTTQWMSLPVRKCHLSSQPAQAIPTAPPTHTHHTLQRIFFL